MTPKPEAIGVIREIRTADTAPDHQSDAGDHEQQRQSKSEDDLLCVAGTGCDLPNRRKSDRDSRDCEHQPKRISQPLGSLREGFRHKMERQKQAADDTDGSQQSVPSVSSAACLYCTLTITFLIP
jgi:hypothetical protein